jgi:hypothetical protein
VRENSIEKHQYRGLFLELEFSNLVRRHLRGGSHHLIQEVLTQTLKGRRTSLINKPENSLGLRNGVL